MVKFLTSALFCVAALIIERHLIESGHLKVNWCDIFYKGDVYLRKTVKNIIFKKFSFVSFCEMLIFYSRLLLSASKGPLRMLMINYKTKCITDETDPPHHAAYVIFPLSKYMRKILQLSSITDFGIIENIYCNPVNLRNLTQNATEKSFSLSKLLLTIGKWSVSDKIVISNGSPKVEIITISIYSKLIQ